MDTWDDREKAWDDEEKALELNDDGVDFFEQGKFAEALACFNELVLSNPEDEDAWGHK